MSGVNDTKFMESEWPMKTCVQNSTYTKFIGHRKRSVLTKSSVRISTCFEVVYLSNHTPHVCKTCFINTAMQRAKQTHLKVEIQFHTVIPHFDNFIAGSNQVTSIATHAQRCATATMNIVNLKTDNIRSNVCTTPEDRDHSLIFPLGLSSMKKITSK
jgi:hypothetical protein